MAKYTTIALEKEDKQRLDKVSGDYMVNESPSYREIINFLIDRVEERSDNYEKILARAISNANENDVMNAITRVERDKAFVEELNDE